MSYSINYNFSPQSLIAGQSAVTSAPSLQLSWNGKDPKAFLNALNQATAKVSGLTLKTSSADEFGIVSSPFKNILDQLQTASSLVQTAAYKQSISDEDDEDKKNKDYGGFAAVLS